MARRGRHRGVARRVVQQTALAEDGAGAEHGDITAVAPHYQGPVQDPVERMRWGTLHYDVDAVGHLEDLRRRCDPLSDEPRQLAGHWQALEHGNALSELVDLTRVGRVQPQ